MPKNQRVGFDLEGQRVLRKQIKRLALVAIFEKFPRFIVGMEACLSAHFVNRSLRELGFAPRIVPAIYLKPFSKGQKNDYDDAEWETFLRGRDFAAWVGLVPRQYSTGGRTVLGRITKRGSRYLRTLFVQAAKIIMRRPHRWADFNFGDWLTKAAERMNRNKLATALANKLARVAWSILRYNSAFDAPRDEVAVCV